MSTSINQVLSDLEKKLNEINAMKNKIYIVNAGITNNGKSSTFNSLLRLKGKLKPDASDEMAFKVKDVRTTIKNKEIEYCSGVYLLDTPGLEAEDQDEKIALDAYKKASLIVFVHKIRAGELHADEIKWISDIQKCIPADELKKHFCIVLTQKEDDIQNQKGRLDTIKTKVREQIRDYCGLKDVTLFCIANTTLEKGLREDKKKLSEISGVYELKEYIDENIPQYRKEMTSRAECMIEKAKEEARKKLRSQIQDAKAEMNRKRSEANRRYKKFQQDLNTMVEVQDRMQANCQEKSAKLNSSREKVRQLEAQHSTENGKGLGGVAEAILKQINTGNYRK